MSNTFTFAGHSFEVKEEVKKAFDGTEHNMFVLYVDGSDKAKMSHSNIEIVKMHVVDNYMTRDIMKETEAEYDAENWDAIIAKYADMEKNPWD